MISITLPGVYSMPNAVYHRDPVPGGSLSSSGARKLLPPSAPAIFKYERDHPVYKDVFDFGSAAHKVVLGDLDEKVVVIDADDWRTKAAKEERDEARVCGFIPILRDDWEKVQEMAAAIQANPTAAALLAPDSGTPEQSLFWQDEETGIWRRARADWLPHETEGRMILVDYKSTRSAHPDRFSKSAVDYGYVMQADWYRTAVIELGLDEDPAFVFVAQDKEPPYLVSCSELTADDIAIGRHLNRQALDIYAECVRTDTWPGYSEGIVTLELPAYFTRKYEELIA
jgi:hypothetical protein